MLPIFSVQSLRVRMKSVAKESVLSPLLVGSDAEQQDKTAQHQHSQAQHSTPHHHTAQLEERKDKTRKGKGGTARGV